MQLALAVAVVLIGCSKDPAPVTPVPITLVPATTPTTATSDASDARVTPDRYHAAAIGIVSDEVAPAKLDWNRRVLTPDELQDAIKMIETNKTKLGTFILLLKDGEFDKYDAKTQRLPYTGPGLRGSDKIDPPLSFATDPTVTRGEMPMGGHARLDIGYLRGTIAVDAAAAQVLIDATAKDPLVSQFLIELEGEAEVDRADVIKAHLHGIRVVRQGAHEVYLEGKPTKLGY